MSDYEAPSGMKPQIQLEGQRSGKAGNIYFLVICVFFAVILMLCVNNLFLYKAYKSFYMQYYEAFSSMKSISVDKESLIGEKENLLKEIDRVIKENEKIRAASNTIEAQNSEIIKKLEEIKAANDELSRKNKELIDDNIALQNSLKKAASVGIKPQNYTSFNGLANRGELDRGNYVGKFLGTAYTPSHDECGNNNGITNSGRPIVPGISVAVDSKYWPFGTVFYIKGLGYAVAMDTGSAIKGKHRFDFAVFDKNFAKTLGSGSWDVYLVRLGDGKVKDERL